MEWQLIESDADLQAALAAVAGSSVVAVDTEFMRTNTFYPKIALLQLYAGDEVYLIDPLAITDLDGLRAMLTDPGHLKVLHSGSEDLEVFSRWLGILPEPLIDTQRAAALLGEAGGLGYRNIVERLLGVELDKGETRSDWLRRPLTDSQCHYAAMDVLHLLPVWEILKERALSADRMPWLLEEGVELRRAMEDREHEPFRRVKGAGKLNARQLATLARLVAWREERARNADKPRGWVLDDKACVAIARAMPSSQAALEDLGVLPPSVLRKQGNVLLDIVEQSAKLHQDELPASFPSPLDERQRGQLKTLKHSAREHAAKIGVAPELMLTAADLELLVRERSGEPVKMPRRWAGWRQDMVIRPLRELAA